VREHLARAAGIVSLVLGAVGAIAGLVLYYSCTRTFFGGCVQYGFRDVGLLAMIFGGVLVVVGIVLFAIPEKQAMPAVAPPYAYPMPPSMYQPPVSAATPNVQRNEMFCPTCGNHYPAEYKVCPRDSSELRSIS